MTRVTSADVNLQLVGSVVEFIGIDFSITLRFSNSCTVGLGIIFSLTAPEGDSTTIDPEGDKACFVPVLRLHSETVEAAQIEGSHLIMAFSNGSTINAGPDGDYESWSYTGPEHPNTRVIAMPGGALAIWLP